MSFVFAKVNAALIITKNRLVTRDADMLSEMAALRIVSVCISLTSLDLKLQQVLEPRPEQQLIFNNKHALLGPVLRLVDQGILHVNRL